MNNIRKAAIIRWKKDLEENLAKIKADKKSLIKKAAICGFLAGDGCVKIRKERKEDKFFRYQCDLFADDKEMLNTYLKFVKEVYNLSPKVSRRDNMYDVRLSQRFITIDLTKLCKFGIYTWTFPNSLFKIKGAKEAWLKAFFSAEAYIGKKVIKIQSVNLKSIKKVKVILHKMGIKCNYYEYQSNNPNHSKVGMIFVNDKKSRELYHKKIGFWHAKKERVLKEALNL